MLIAERMSRELITVMKGTTVPEALRTMREHNVRRLPVVDEGGHLVGIVSEKDLLYASPSPATTLSIYEMQALLGRITVEEVMSSEVITVTESSTLEEAARIMIDNKIGGMPVVRGDELVGIITETDLFKSFLELLGGREHGVRITVSVQEQKGALCRLTDAIAGMGGNILSLGTFLGDDPSSRQITMKIADVTKEALRENIEDVTLEILDIRDT